jgi:hydrogenase nickel incorporation protein HypA/HybF
LHELSLAELLLPPVLALAEEHGARVTLVVVQAGELQAIVPDSLRLGFASLAAGTAAEGAELVVEIVPVTARCRRCGGEFVVQEHVYVCPACGVADVETTGGTDLVLTRVELED